MSDEEKIRALTEENAKLKEELQTTKEHLKKYTAPSYKKEYYEKNKDIIKERVRKHKERTNYKPSPEQKKEYNKQAYIRKKEMEKKLNNDNI
jgi:hypothetical protein